MWKINLAPATLLPSHHQYSSLIPNEWDIFPNRRLIPRWLQSPEAYSEAWQCLIKDFSEIKGLCPFYGKLGQGNEFRGRLER